MRNSDDKHAVLHVLREMQEEIGVQLTDDEVKGALCRALNEVDFSRGDGLVPAHIIAIAGEIIGLRSATATPEKE